MSLDEVVFELAEALRYPVQVLALAALAFALAEAGRCVIEVHRRRGRTPDRLDAHLLTATEALARGDRGAARTALEALGGGAAWNATIARLLQPPAPNRPGRSEDRAAKALADHDLGALRRLERSRLLVRAGPALGLMGTLIPLSPALASLGEGSVRQLANGLRIAFGITVLGILVGLIGFVVSLVRDRLYAQDRSDLETLAAALETPRETAP